MTLIRTFHKQLKERLLEKEPLIQALIGPRQIGKTTAVRSIAEDLNGHYISADLPTPTSANSITEIWDLATKSESNLLVIDEIQKVQNWEELIKKLWDSPGKRPRLVITGSSALLMQSGLRESLSGRFELLFAEHWNFAEAHSAFGLDLSEFIEWGCYPGSIRFLKESGGSTQRWADYIRDSIIEPAIGRDLMQLRPIQNPALLREVFALSSCSPAQIISLQKLVGQLQDKAAVATIKDHLNLLGFSFLISALQKYSTAPVRIRSSSPKLIIHDNSFLRVFERPVNQKLNPAQYGKYVENAVGARLIESGWEVYYWRERDLEVDYILLGPNGENIALEVKSSNFDERDLKGLRYFCRKFPGFTPCIASMNKINLPGVVTVQIEQVLSVSRNKPSFLLNSNF